MSLLYSHIFSCFITVNTLFLLFSVITVESASKMAAKQVLFNSISSCVTTLTDLKRWIVIELIQIIYQACQSESNIKFIKSTHLKYGIYKPREVEHPKKKLVRKRTRFFIGSVYKSHILNGPINKLFTSLSPQSILNILTNFNDHVFMAMGIH